MTREEAIERLKNTAWLGSNNDRESTEEAVRMAIEALNDMAERKDEPQTELVNDSQILVKDLVDDEFNPYDEECMRCKHLKLQCEFVSSYCKYEPKDETQTNADQHVESVDLISRQDAFRTFQVKVCHGVACSECQTIEEDGTCRIEAWLKDIPSAEPKREECEEREQGLCPFYAG